MPNAAYGMQEPEKYLPERFMEGTPEAAAKPAHGYLPFGDGTRACIGLRFAQDGGEVKEHTCQVSKCTDRIYSQCLAYMANKKQQSWQCS